MAQGSASGLVLVSGSLLEELIMELRTLVANMAGQLPDPAGRTRVSLDATGLGATVNITNLTTVASVLALTNLLQEGGQPANTNVGSLLNIGADIGQRACIVVS